MPRPELGLDQSRIESAERVWSQQLSRGRGGGGGGGGEEKEKQKDQVVDMASLASCGEG